MGVLGQREEKNAQGEPVPVAGLHLRPREALTTVRRSASVLLSILFPGIQQALSLI